MKIEKNVNRPSLVKKKKLVENNIFHYFDNSSIFQVTFLDNIFFFSKSTKMKNAVESTKNKIVGLFEPF